MVQLFLLSGLAEGRQDMDKEGASPRVRQFARPMREIVHADQEIDEAAVSLSLQEGPLLPVIDGDEIVGVLTQGDLVRARQAEQAEGAQLIARVVMSSDLAFCYLDDDVATARALMDGHGCDHLLVIDADQALVGLVGREDLPAVSAAEAPSHDRAVVVEPRGEDAPGIAKTIQPGGLDVYAERPKLKARRD
jgi:CBS domain-containing protein